MTLQLPDVSGCTTLRVPANKLLIAFSDASLKGYGSVVYLRQEDCEGNACISFVLGKSRIAPMKATTVPRLELTAALTSVKLICLIQRELKVNADVLYLTDSKAVLGYIAGDQQRWPMFVANRVATIRKFSKPHQWHYIPSESNPADQASRGLKASDLLEESHWICGPNFLQNPRPTWPIEPICEAEDSCCASEASEPQTDGVSTRTPTQQLLSYFSSWKQLKMCVAVFSKFIMILQAKVKQRNGEKIEVDGKISAHDLEKAECSILRFVHKECFPEEILALSDRSSSACLSSSDRRKSGVKRKSSLYKLDPILDSGLLRVGGRLRRTLLPASAKHPIILPRRHCVTLLIIRDEHVRLGHAGRAHVLSSLRERYWLINGNSRVRHVISSCVRCRRLRAPCMDQKMADLPECRFDDDLPPFSHTGIDFFGPFSVKERRSTIKRYGVVFTCMASRCVHLEIAASLDADSCINAIRRFIARRGRVITMYSDNGTNLTAASKALESRLRDFGIDWVFNPPKASHWGGTWERTIRTVRKVLDGLLMEHGERLDLESLQTLMCEVEAIINSRPLTTTSSDSTWHANKTDFKIDHDFRG